MVIKILPVPKPRMTRADKWRKRDSGMRYRNFCDELGLKVGSYEVPPTLRLSFSIPMPPSWSQKKRERMMDTPHQQKPDIDNLVKAFLDALCEDDSYVWNVNASKIWGKEGRIEIEED